MVAAAVTAYGDYSDNEDPSIGTLEFYIKGWLDDGSPIKFTKLKTRPCTLEEFSFQSDKVKRDTPFWQIHVKSDSYKDYIPSMKCIDEDYELYGEFETNVAHNLMVVFERCDPEQRTCADDAVIDEWMQFKYILTVENEENYLQTRPAGNRMEQYAKISWFGLSPNTRVDKVKRITFEDIQLMKSPLGISFQGGTNIETERILRLEESQSRILPYKNKMVNAITYEVNHKRIFVQRVDYTLF